MTQPIATRLQAVARKPLRRCEVVGCFRTAHRVGSYCWAHNKTRQRTGVADGRVLARSEWHGWRDEIACFIEVRRDHPGIAAALAWLHKLIVEARPPQRVTRRTPPHDRFAFYLARMEDRGVDPVTVLASAAAIYAVREADPRAFKSDRAFTFQLATAVLSVVPRPRQPGRGRWNNGKQATVDATSRLKEHVGRLIETAIGLLASRLGSEVVKRSAAPPPILGQGLPFDATTTSSTSTTGPIT